MLHSASSIEEGATADPASAMSAQESHELRVQQWLATAIYEHRVLPGTKLPEADLCRIYGTTRGVVRKVLARLASERLVELIPNRGAFVARPSVEHTRDVFGLRRILEAGVMRELSRSSSQVALEGIRRQVDEEREANRSGDTGRYIRLAGKFHLDLAAATGNAALTEHLKLVIAETSLMVALYDMSGANICSVHEHLEILDAMDAGEHERAERLMDEHLHGCERLLRLDAEEAPVPELAQALAVPGVSPDDGGSPESVVAARPGQGKHGRTSRPRGGK